jgi:uncharacterized protein YlaN (UPF0358 family)
MYLFYFMLQVITLMIDSAKEQILIEFQTSSVGLPQCPSLTAS